MNWTLFIILLVWLIGAVLDWFVFLKNSDDGIFGKLVMCIGSWAIPALYVVTWIAKKL